MLGSVQKYLFVLLFEVMSKRHKLIVKVKGYRGCDTKEISGNKRNYSILKHYHLEDQGCTN